MSTPQRERKVVTVLFADLVGFTSRAEALDPEDVEAILRPYHEHLRRELQRFGGTVEKFIGDAVMALFGAPVAHEDDAERGARAALEIRDWVVEQGRFEVRIALATGEALVRLAARPAEGEGMASGDIVNTAARLQAAAPVNGVLVDEATFQATRQVIEYRDAPAVVAKGKAAPISVHEALAARGRVGVEHRETRTELVGRRRELDQLVDALARARAEASPQLITLVGVPGIGKSRLVRELLRVADDDPELIRWRRGRSLPYGEGVAFWSLGEIVKAEAGVLETDSPEAAEDKLARAVEAVVADEREVDRVRRHLRPLLGLGDGTRADSQDQAFAAWRRFLEGMAEQNPTVLVFEDLHWADDDLLEFVDELAGRATGVPLLVVCTARPELLERRPTWGGGKRNALTLSLAPLSREETARLVGVLLGRSALPADDQALLLERAEGNPLYAEEYVRLFLEGGLAGAPAPFSLQALIAARLDALRPAEKALVQDAAVIGSVAWVGAAAAIGCREATEVEALFAALERKELVRRQRRSTVEGETEYAFHHGLVREVSYGAIPRAERAEKHRLAGLWIESLGRADDHAEMLAHHYATALELAGAAGAETTWLEERARRALRRAGDRAMALNAAAAATRLYARALALWPDDDERPSLLLRYARSRLDRFDYSEDTIPAAERARDGLLARGDVEGAAEAETVLGELDWNDARNEQAFEHFGRARELVSGREPSASVAYVLAQVSRFLMLGNRNEEALATGREALALARALDHEALEAHCLNTIGVARVGAGDRGGLEDLEESLAIAERISSPERLRAAGNLASLVVDLGHVERGRTLYVELGRLAREVRSPSFIRWVAAELAVIAYAQGDWAEALARADEFSQDGVQPHYMEHAVRVVRGSIGLARGSVEPALMEFELALERARSIREPQALYPCLARVARELARAGRSDEALARLREAVEKAERDPFLPNAWVIDAAIAFVALGEPEGAAPPLAVMRPATMWSEAAAALVAGEPARSAELLAAAGARAAEADVRVLAARAALEAGLRSQSDAQLARATAFYREVGAVHSLGVAERLLRAAG
jgi:class 3 adenylate cyclase/tetratricopeptide (TPR) repeat protein